MHAHADRLSTCPARHRSRERETRKPPALDGQNNVKPEDFGSSITCDDQSRRPPEGCEGLAGEPGAATCISILLTDFARLPFKARLFFFCPVEKF